MSRLEDVQVRGERKETQIHLSERKIRDRILPWNHFGSINVNGFQAGSRDEHALFARPSFKAKCTDKKVKRGNSLFTAAEYIVRLLIGKANGVFKSINKRGRGRKALKGEVRVKGCRRWKVGSSKR